MHKKTNILIIDDSIIFSQGLSLLLEQYPCQIHTISIAHNYKKALELLTTNDISVIILDLNFESKDYNGFTIAKKVKTLYPKIKILILTQQAKIDHYEILFHELKVHGYLDKQLGIEETLEAINCVMNDQTYVDHNIKTMLEIGKWLDISKREKEIISLLEIGYTQKEIAEKLHISQRTVETHIKNLTKKIDAKNTTQLISIYVKYKNSNRESNALLETVT